jgi:TolA-binding protein
MRIDHLTIVLLGILPLAGCSTTKGSQEDPVLVKLTQIDARLSKVESTLNSDSMVQLVNQLQSTQEEVRSLRGEIESARNDIESLRAQQRDRYLNLDGRLAAIERGGGAAAVSPGPSDSGADASGDTAASGAGAVGGAASAGSDANCTILRSISEERPLRRGGAELSEAPREPWPQSSYAGMRSTGWRSVRAARLRQGAAGIHARGRAVSALEQGRRCVAQVGFCQYELGTGRTRGRRSSASSSAIQFAAKLASERLDRMKRDGH